MQCENEIIIMLLKKIADVLGFKEGHNGGFLLSVGTAAEVEQSCLPESWPSHMPEKKKGQSIVVIWKTHPLVHRWYINQTKPHYSWESAGLSALVLYIDSAGSTVALGPVGWGGHTMPLASISDRQTHLCPGFLSFFFCYIEIASYNQVLYKLYIQYIHYYSLTRLHIRSQPGVPSL